MFFLKNQKLIAAVTLVISSMGNLADKHALWKSMAKKNYAPWLDNELKSLMAEQDVMPDAK